MSIKFMDFFFEIEHFFQLKKFLTDTSVGLNLFRFINKSKSIYQANTF